MTNPDPKLIAEWLALYDAVPAPVWAHYGLVVRANYPTEEIAEFLGKSSVMPAQFLALLTIIKAQREALDRLGSSEGFVGAGIIGKELRARMTYAREALRLSAPLAELLEKPT